MLKGIVKLRAVIKAFSESARAAALESRRAKSRASAERISTVAAATLNQADDKADRMAAREARVGEALGEYFGEGTKGMQLPKDIEDGVGGVSADRMVGFVDRDGNSKVTMKHPELGLVQVEQSGPGRFTGIVQGKNGPKATGADNGFAVEAASAKEAVESVITRAKAGLVAGTYLPDQGLANKEFNRWQKKYSK